MEIVEINSTSSHKCNCDESLNGQVPILDARVIPHEVRHAAIFGALDSLKSGAALVIVAHHAPKPLIAQAKIRYNDGFTIDYLVEGPDSWHVRFKRQ